MVFRIRFARVLFAPVFGLTLAFVLVLTVVSSCAGPQQGGFAGTRKFPPRPPTCLLTIFHAPAPDVAAWDDLGVAEVICHTDLGSTQCLQRFRAEACRMGGDIVYALPEKPLRPREQAIVYRGRVAHRRAPPPGSNGP